MDDGDEYEKETATHVLLEHGYAVGGYNEEIEPHNSSSSSSTEDGNDPDDHPNISSPHTTDIPSVCRLPVPVMVPADRVSTHDRPLAAPLAVVERELFHIHTLYFTT